MLCLSLRKRRPPNITATANAATVTFTGAMLNQNRRALLIVALLLFIVGPAVFTRLAVMRPVIGVGDADGIVGVESPDQRADHRDAVRVGDRGPADKD